MTDHCTTDFCIWRTIWLVPLRCISSILHMYTTDFAYDGPIFLVPLSLSYPSSPVLLLLSMSFLEFFLDSINWYFFFDFDFFRYVALIYPRIRCICLVKSWSIDQGFSPYKDPPSFLYFLLQWYKKSETWQCREMLFKSMWPSMLTRSIAEYYDKPPLSFFRYFNSFICFFTS